jgi:N-carbamoylputrescine amidase
MTTPPHPRRFMIGLVQMSMSDNSGENLRHATEMIREAAGKGARVICLPELFRSRYFCQREETAMFDLAESVPGPTTDSLGETAKSLGVVIIAPVF